MEDQIIKGMKVTELREALKAAGLSPLGKKDELVARLVESQQAAGSTDAAAAAPTPVAPHQPDQEGLLKLDPMSVERMRMRQARFGCTSERLRQAEQQEALSKRSARFQQ